METVRSLLLMEDAHPFRPGPQHSGHRCNRRRRCSFCRVPVHFAPWSGVYVALWVTTKSPPDRIVTLMMQAAQAQNRRVMRKKKQKKQNQIGRIECEDESASECKLLSLFLPLITTREPEGANRNRYAGVIISIRPPLRNSAADKHVSFISVFFFFAGGTNCSFLSLLLRLPCLCQQLIIGCFTGPDCNPGGHF